MDEKARDMCGAEEGGGGGGLVIEEAHGDMCGGGSMDKVDHDTSRGGGGGMSMDDASADTFGPRRGGIPIRRRGGSVNGAYGDACDGE